MPAWKKFFEILCVLKSTSSHHSSMVSMAACYQGGSGVLLKEVFVRWLARWTFFCHFQICFHINKWNNGWREEEKMFKNFQAKVFPPAFRCMQDPIFYKIVNDSQLFIGKNVFLEEKAHFLGVKQSTSVLVQTQKTCFLLKFAANFLLF